MDRIECSREDLYVAGSQFALMQMAIMGIMDANPDYDNPVPGMVAKLFNQLSDKQQELVNIMMEEQDKLIDAEIMRRISKQGFKFKYEA